MITEQQPSLGDMTPLASPGLIEHEKKPGGEVTPMELIPFYFENHPIRIIIIDGMPWFVAKDVCDVLGMVNSRDATSRLDVDQKGVGITDISSSSSSHKTITVIAVNESGLYDLTLDSRNPEARRIRKSRSNLSWSKSPPLNPRGSSPSTSRAIRSGFT